MPKVVFLDMDGVLADFDAALCPESKVTWDPPEMFVPGFFRKLAPVPGAKEAVAALLAEPGLSVYIGSKPTTKNTLSATEKLDWVAEHFPALLKRVLLICDKGLLRGDVLVDDDAEAWSKKFVGRFIHFDRKNPAQAWAKVLEELLPRRPAQPWTDGRRSTTSGRAPVLDGPAPEPVDPATGQHGAYWVLSDAEIAKGLTRPLRNKYVHKKCGVVTRMGDKLSETYARDPKFYTHTFCVSCAAHLPVSEFLWDGTAEEVGS